MSPTHLLSSFFVIIEQTYTSDVICLIMPSHLIKVIIIMLYFCYSKAHLMTANIETSFKRSLFLNRETKKVEDASETNVSPASLFDQRNQFPIFMANSNIPSADCSSPREIHVLFVQIQ